MTTTVADYRMNPAEDVILFRDDIREGMLVLIEDRAMRRSYSGGEEEQLRKQRFRKVTRLRREPLAPEPGFAGGTLLTFIGEWVDGYQEIHRYNVSHGWLVKKDSIPEAMS
jgi:hypothetical protein